MTIIFKSKLNNKELLKISNSQIMEGKTSEEVLQQYEAMKYEEFDEESNVIGYVCGNYILEEDFDFEIRE